MTPAFARYLGAVLTACVITAPPPLLACAACFGRSDSPMAQGMNMGILSVLVGIASFFIYIIRRASRMATQSETAADVPPLNSGINEP